MTVRIAILIGTPKGTRLMAASSERSAALMVEAALFGIAPEALPVPLWVQCEDEGLAERLTAYLNTLQADIASVPADWSPP
ncbi:hypothetical protein [Methylobacterium sp. A54F]